MLGRCDFRCRAKVAALAPRHRVQDVALADCAVCFSNRFYCRSTAQHALASSRHLLEASGVGLENAQMQMDAVEKRLLD